jgi:hypothetical protein
MPPPTLTRKQLEDMYGDAWYAAGLQISKDYEQQQAESDDNDDERTRPTPKPDSNGLDCFSCILITLLAVILGPGTLFVVGLVALLILERVL